MKKTILRTFNYNLLLRPNKVDFFTNGGIQRELNPSASISQA